MNPMQQPNSKDFNNWRSESRVDRFVSSIESRPHSQEIKAILHEQIPTNVLNILDLGTGDGRILAMVKQKNPNAKGVGLDFSDPMIQRAKQRFQHDNSVQIIKHDLNDPLPKAIDEPFDLVISGLAIHHVDHQRKKQLYTEIFQILKPNGVFLNLDHVASPTPELHQKFLQAVGLTPETDDPANILLDVHTQLQWLKQIGYKNVDCVYKWLEIAILTGTKP